MAFREFLAKLYPGGREDLIQEDTFGDEVAARIMREQDLPTMKRLFAEIPDRWSDRYFYSLAFSRRTPVDVLQHWCRSDMESADAHLVLGARLFQLAWEARGYGRGSEITEKQAEEFFRRVDMTKNALERCAELHPEDPTPWAYLVMISVYGQYEDEQKQFYFDEAIKRDPENWPAHMHRLMSLTEKWSGSHEAMFEFARGVVRDARPGSLLPAILFKAHLEYWKYLDLFEEDYERAEGYLKRRDVRDESHEVYQKTLGSNTYDENMAIFARINTAGWFYLIEDMATVRTELSELGTRIKHIHWRWVGLEGKLSAARKKAGLF